MEFTKDNRDELRGLGLEGKKVKVITDTGEEITDVVFYQGALDWDKLNNNEGVHSIGYEYLSFISYKGMIKYDNILSVEILDDDNEE